MWVLVLALQTAAATSPATDDKRDIVVTAARPEDSGRAWKACRKRHCPPDEEIHAALVHAETLFVAGDYRQAQSVIAATVDATRGAAALYPVPVGDLRRAQATIASHRGDPTLARQGMIQSGAALRTGLGEADARVLIQRLQTADSLMLREPRPATQVGGPRSATDSRESALRGYDAVARDARRLGLAEIEGRALLRRAALLTGLAAADPRTYGRRARVAIAALTGRADPRIAPHRQAALVLAARLDAAGGDTAALDPVVDLVSTQPSATPVLLYAPPIDWQGDPARAQTLARRTVAQNQADAVDLSRSDQWIDLGFRIGPDGRVADAEILRASDAPAGSWTGPVLAAVRLRRYARPDPAAAAMRRVERHSYTATSEPVTGTRIALPNGRPRIAVTDLTDDVAAPAPVPAPSG